MWCLKKINLLIKKIRWEKDNPSSLPIKPPLNVNIIHSSTPPWRCHVPHDSCQPNGHMNPNPSTGPPGKSKTFLLNSHAKRFKTSLFLHGELCMECFLPQSLLCKLASFLCSIPSGCKIPLLLGQLWLLLHQFSWSTWYECSIGISACCF